MIFFLLLLVVYYTFASGGFLIDCDILGFCSSNDAFNQLFINVACGEICSQMDISTYIANIGGELIPWP
ncbi:hypothetical protein GGR55DRAFT_625038, partial [Xylaria sp. FL0064]